MLPRVSSIFALCSAVVLGVACSNQSEGEPCDPSVNDCQNGLTCQTFSGVTGPRCCPADLQLATSPSCANQHAALMAPTEPPDGGGDGAESTDAPASASESAPPGTEAASPQASPDAASE